MDRKKLVKKLDRIFSQYVRLKASDDNGMVHCVTCGKYIPWKESDAGHYVNRKWLSLRWDERNVHPQCKSCNRFDEGNLPAYSVWIEKTYGPGATENLLLKKSGYKYAPYELEIMIKEYSDKMKELKNQKNY